MALMKVMVQLYILYVVQRGTLMSSSCRYCYIFSFTHLHRFSKITALLRILTATCQQMKDSSMRVVFLRRLLKSVPVSNGYLYGIWRYVQCMPALHVAVSAQDAVHLPCQYCSTHT